MGADRRQLAPRSGRSGPHSAHSPGTKVAPPAGRNLAAIPVPRDKVWIRRHHDLAKAARDCGPEVLLLGDSITDAWRDVGRAAWERNFADVRAANLGMDGDRTQHLLWRLRDDGIEEIAPRVVVLMIGTNNTGFESDGVTPRNSPREAARGVAEVLGSIRQQMPQAKVLLLAILPRGQSGDHPQRGQVNEINARLAKFHDGQVVHLVDVGQQFVDADGTLSAKLMPDFLHPSAMGYEVLAKNLRAPITRLLTVNDPELLHLVDGAMRPGPKDLAT